MDERKLDALIEESLNEQVKQVKLSSSLECRVKQEIRQIQAEQVKEEKRMKLSKLFVKKRIAVLAAAMCILGTMGVAAAGKISGYRTGYSANNTVINTIADIKKAEKEVGFPVKAVESFENGYRLEQGYVNENEGIDDSGQIVKRFKDVFIEYKNAGKRLTYFQEPAYLEQEESVSPIQEEIPCGDLTLTYKVDYYRFVPEGYEISEEEQKAVDAGELYISYGSSEVENVEFHMVIWQQDGVRYTLMTHGADALGQEELTAMAEELIELE